MKNKPWPILVLGMIQFLMPFFDTVMNAYLVPTTPGIYLRAFLKASNAWEIFEFFALYPLAGISIMLMKTWSYPVFLMVITWSTISNTIIWMSGQAITQSTTFFIFITFSNLAFVTYYLLPAVRKVYFDKRIKWWESKPRFFIDLPAKIQVKDSFMDCHIRDLSIGGAFLESNLDYKISDIIHLNFKVFNTVVNIESKIVHIGNRGASKGIGIQFCLNKNETLKIKKIVKALKLLGCDMRSPADGFWDSFKDWLNHAIRGKKEGFLPVIRS